MANISRRYVWSTIVMLVASWKDGATLWLEFFHFGRAVDDSRQGKIQKPEAHILCAQATQAGAFRMAIKAGKTHRYDPEPGEVLVNRSCRKSFEVLPQQFRELRKIFERPWAFFALEKRAGWDLSRSSWGSKWIVSVGWYEPALDIGGLCDQPSLSVFSPSGSLVVKMSA
jgi:hypothetical protein